MWNSPLPVRRCVDSYASHGAALLSSLRSLTRALLSCFHSGHLQIQLLEDQAPGFSFAIVAMAGPDPGMEDANGTTYVFRASDQLPGRIPLASYVRFFARVSVLHTVDSHNTRRGMALVRSYCGATNH